MDSEKRNTMTVPYYVYDGAQARAERAQKRLIIVIVILLGLLFASNMAWLYVFQQYDYESYEQDGDGVNIIGNNNSEVYNGAEIPSAQEKSGQQGQSDAKEA